MLYAAYRTRYSYNTDVVGSMTDIAKRPRSYSGIKKAFQVFGYPTWIRALLIRPRQIRFNVDAELVTERTPRIGHRL